MRFPLFNPLESRDGTLAKDANLKNAVVEIEEEAVLIVKRPGMVFGTEQVAGGIAQGLVAFNFLRYSIVNDILWFPSPVSGNAGYNFASDSFVPAPSLYNFAIDPGPTYPLTPAEYLNPPYSYPSDLKNFTTIQDIVDLMNANYSGVGVWSFSDYADIGGGPTNYPTYTGYVWANMGAGDAYVQVLKH